MPSLIALLGSCLVAVSAAAAADRSADSAGEPWWSNPPTAQSPNAGPRIPEYGSAVSAGSEHKAADTMPPARATAPSEFAPDPPGLLDPHAQTAAYQEDSASPTKRQVDKAKPIQSAREATAKPLPTTPRPEAPPPANPKPSASATVAPTTTTAVAIQPAQAEAATPMVVGSHNDKSAPGKGSPLSAMITVGGSLAIVLGLFLVIAWAMRKAAPRGSLVLPKEVFAILGRAPLGARQQVQLLRCGNKLLLVSITPNGVETLTEITEPLEVDRIAGICQQSDPKSSTTSFRQVFQQLAPASGKPPELDNLEPSPARRKRYHWEDKNA